MFPDAGAETLDLRYKDISVEFSEIFVHSELPSEAASAGGGEVACDHELANMKTAYMEVLHCERPDTTSLQRERADGQASDRQRPDRGGAKGQRADRHCCT